MKKSFEAQVYIASSNRSPLMVLENKGKKKKRALEDLIREALGLELNVIHSQGYDYQFDARRGMEPRRHPDRPPRVQGNKVFFSNTEGEKFDNILPYTKKVKITIEVE